MIFKLKPMLFHYSKLFVSDLMDVICIGCICCFSTIAESRGEHGKPQAAARCRTQQVSK